MRVARSVFVAALWVAAPLFGAEGLDLKPSQCGGLHASSDILSRSLQALPPLERREFSLRGDFCSEYGYAGWEKPLRLYLGEGAAEHLAAIEAGVWLWNSALEGFRRERVIEIVQGSRPRTFSPGSDIWTNSDSASARNVQDGQSVIYFTSSSSADSEYAGFARMREWGGSMVEADVYINTAVQQEFGYDLALTFPLLRTGGGRIIHALVDPVYFKVAHELGHALGLNHVPVSGNVMSYNYMPAMLDKWLPATEFLELALDLTENSEFLEQLSTPSVLPGLVGLTTEWEIYVRHVFTRSMSAGEQDRMALMCIYDFEDWNH